MGKEKIVSVIALVLVAGGVAALGFWGYQNKPVAVTKTETVAKVNGVEITKSAYDTQLASVIASLKSQGVDTESVENLTQIKTQVLNDLINNEIVLQAITKAGIKSTDAQVEEQYQGLVTQAGGVDKLNEQITAASLTQEQFRANIARQLSIQTYLLQNIDISSATATDKEAQDFYNTNVKGQENAPTYKEVVDQIKQQIIANKQQLLVNTFIASLREKATVETTI